ncbi:tripartite tricarboxylate transporter substrate binding protein [Rubrobacter taiwanensis]|jgi:tripartite-type tricarboxylate transporter receptor subunit TctC|uniref:Tripartite tricarboxylate transporter substrate binding protein n=1 Tax=Rubrobacter taiwanensis TaxID=185139 RepID=A0A4R1BEV2_9ACTN|nr:tripartite tricarboxylate transporter substrate binding protein [Rubrobacter taiwanensis]
MSVSVIRLRRSLAASLGVLVIALLAFSCGPGAEYPSRPVELIVPFGPGGAADVAARQIAELASEELGESIQVRNVTGGGGAVAYNEVVNAPNDGYTAIWSSAALNTLAAAGNIDFNYEAFEHVAIVSTETVTLAVAADSEWENLEDFIADARNRTPTVGNSGMGSTTHLTAVALAEEAGVEFEHVPFGDGLAIASVMGGEIDASVQHPAEIMSQYEAGDIRILAITSPERIETFEDVPTAQEQGVDVVLEQWRGISLPEGTDEEVIQRLEDAFTQAAETDEWAEFTRNTGADVRIMGSEEATEFIADMQQQIDEIAAAAEEN